MSFYWGNYVHKVNEVVPLKVSQKYLQTERGIRWAVQVELHIGGDFVPDDPSVEMSPEDVTARILAMDEAYRNDYQDCGFTMNGQLTPHYMLNSDPYNLSGNQIVYRSWDNVLPTEYANTRSFKIIISALTCLTIQGSCSSRSESLSVATGDQFGYCKIPPMVQRRSMFFQSQKSHISSKER